MVLACKCGGEDNEYCCWCAFTYREYGCIVMCVCVCLKDARFAIAKVLIENQKVLH